MKKYFFFLLSLFWFVLCIFPPFVFAHKVKIFAAVEGKSISGYAYYTSSSRPKNVKIVLSGPDGKLIEELISNEQGEFHTEALYRVDTLVQLKSADGHSAEWLLSEDEFPTDLARYPENGQGIVEKKVTANLDQVAEEEVVAKDKELFSIDENDFSSLIRRELLPLQKQLGLLRAELAAQEEKKQFQDILGGIGYLIGLAGIISYLAARRRKEH